jgi:hypothetical protein
VKFVVSRLPLFESPPFVHDIFLFLSALHMHKSGVRMTNEVIRDGEVFHKAVVDVFDFDQQGVSLASVLATLYDSIESSSDV